MSDEQPKTKGQLVKWFSSNWEKWLFRLIAIVLFGFAIWKLAGLKITEFSALFALAFFCWFYANISRFKRFKGFGFEAEMWDDKQREAEKLIERLRFIVQEYSGEIIENRILRGRNPNKTDWPKVWGLLNRISNHHSKLGIDIDMSGIEDRMFKQMLSDASAKIIWHAREDAKIIINDIKRRLASSAPDVRCPIEEVDSHINHINEVCELGVSQFDQSPDNLNAESLGALRGWVLELANAVKVINGPEYTGFDKHLSGFDDIIKMESDRKFDASSIVVDIASSEMPA